MPSAMLLLLLFLCINYSLKCIPFLIYILQYFQLIFFHCSFNDTDMINIKTADKSIGRSVSSSNNHNKASFPFPLKNTIFSTFNEPPRNHQPKIIYASSPVSRTCKTQNSLHIYACSFVIKCLFWMGFPFLRHRNSDGSFRAT